MKLFWNSSRAELSPAKGCPTSYLNQNFRVLDYKSQIPTPNLRPAEPKVLDDGNWEPIILTVRHWFSNFHVHWSAKMPGLGVGSEEGRDPKVDVSGWNQSRGNVWCSIRQSGQQPYKQAWRRFFRPTWRTCAFNLPLFLPCLHFPPGPVHWGWVWKHPFPLCRSFVGLLKSGKPDLEGE